MTRSGYDRVRHRTVEARAALHQRVRQLRSGAFAPRTVSNYNRIFRSYRLLCRDMHVSYRPFRYETLALFLAHHVDTGHQSSSIPSVLSDLRKAGEWHLRPLRWISDMDQRALRDFRRAITKEYPISIVRKNPLTKSLLSRLAPFVAADPDPRAPMFFTMAYVAHDALLRFAELAAFTVSDVVWSSDSRDVWLSIRSSKANQGGPPEIQALCTYQDECGASLLAAYWVSRELHRCDASTPLFSDLQDGTPLTRAAFVSWLRRSLQSIGIDDVDGFSGHSMRIGGVCDAWDSNLPSDLIQLGGRWRSAAWRLYLRMRPRMLARRLSAGFRSLR